MKIISAEQLERLKSRYFLYLDESGHATFKSSKKMYRTVNERYLTIGGLLLRGDLLWTSLVPRVSKVIEYHFGPGDVYLHFTDMNNRIGPFANMSEEIRQTFWKEFLEAVASVECTLLSITIDKQRMQDTYQVYRDNPYHLLVAWHIERLIYELTKYEGNLKRKGVFTDQLLAKVIIETRNKESDQSLKRSYRNIYEHGSKRFISLKTEEVQSRLVSNEIAILTKQDNNLGLQIADILIPESNPA